MPIHLYIIVVSKKRCRSNNHNSVFHWQGFVDMRFDGVIVLRPMLNFMANEVALFLHYSGLEPLIETSLSSHHSLMYGPGTSSIQRLTQDFLSSLQFTGFPSTTMAVLRSVKDSVILCYLLRNSLTLVPV